MSPATRFIVLMTLLCVALVAPPTPLARADDCGSLSVSCGAGADPNGYFRGVIGVTGQDWVLDVSSHSGTTVGCGDCTWTVILDCPGNSPYDPDSAPGCAGLGGSSACPPDRTAFRLYLSTAAVTNELIGTVCLGGTSHIVEVGVDGEADVERYLRDLTPPDLRITTRPRASTLTELPTYFTATAPDHGLGPLSFGGPNVSEAITLVPEQVSWQWGDGDATGWVPVASTQAHRYLKSGELTGRLTTMWGATYTATFDGRTVGPYDANGELTRAQPFVERVDTTRPVLVSGE